MKRKRMKNNATSPAALKKVAEKHKAEAKAKKPGPHIPKSKRRGIVEPPSEIISNIHEVSDEELGALYSDLVSLESELGARNLREFARMCWPRVHPGDEYVHDAWHSDCLSDHLQAVAEGDILKLLISIPPGHGKSTWACVFLPTWIWIRAPYFKMGFGSYSYDNVKKEAQKCIKLMKSKWFRDRWGDMFTLEKTDVRYIRTSMGGERSGMSVGGQVLGIRANLIVADDPLNIDQVDSELERGKVQFWWEHGMRSRGDVRRREVVIQQRLHDRDLIGYLLAEKGDYQELVLPSHYNPKRHCVTFTKEGTKFWEDPRKEEGELLFPARFPESYLSQEVGTTDRSKNTYSAMWEQEPVQPGGNIIKTAWLRHYTEPPEKRYKMCSSALLSVDSAIKNKDTAAYTVAQIWGIQRPNAYLIDQVRMRLSFVGIIEMLNNLIIKWNNASGPAIQAKLIEDKASGADIIEVLKQKFPGFIPFDGNDDKEERMHAVSWLFEAGNVYIPGRPTPEGLVNYDPWVQDWVDEITRFPKSAFSDQVVAASQAMVYISRMFKTVIGVPIAVQGRDKLGKIFQHKKRPVPLF
jgi:predicted phage terminase large subunit-like protein